MNVLIIGGTRYFGKYLVRRLVEQKYDVTIATRGHTKDEFQETVKRIQFDRNDKSSIEKAFIGSSYDVVFDMINYSPNDTQNLLEIINTKKYIMVSSAAVYNEGLDIKEEAFDPFTYKVIMGERKDFSYQEGKRLAESVLFQNYKLRGIAVRFPIVIGENDYTHRLKQYVDDIAKEKAIYVDNLHTKLSFIYEKEAGEFLAYLTKCHYTGPINAASSGDILIKELINKIEQSVNKKMKLDEKGISVPYNGIPNNTLNIEKAQQLGYHFGILNDYIKRTIEYYCNE